VELRQLAYLVEVARTGTFSAAAVSLSVAQPALWRQVKELELELGVPLFERAGRRVRLTTDGQAMVEQAAVVLSAVRRLRVGADERRTGRSGLVSIACAAPHLREFLAPVIAAFRADHPAIQLAVREYGGGGPGPGPGMKQDLLDGTVDLATGIAGAEPGLETLPIYDVRLVVAVPDMHPWRRQRVIEVERLRGEPLVVAQRGSYSRGALEAACARAGFAAEIALDSPNPLSILAMGEAGLGLPVIVDDSVAMPAIGRWPTVRLAWRVGGRSAAVSAFIELARAEAGRRTAAPSRYPPARPRRSGGT